MSKIVTLLSGGLDSALMAVLAREQGLEQYPLFVDYGQRAVERELEHSQRVAADLGLQNLQVARLAGYGVIAPSGLTNPDLRIVEDAFTPGRNLLFLLAGAAYGYRLEATAVAIGLLREDLSLFPDQTRAFLDSAQRTFTIAMGRPVSVLSPLMEFSKGDVVELARVKGIESTYSCHRGDNIPCGVCIACKEFSQVTGEK